MNSNDIYFCEQTINSRIEHTNLARVKAWQSEIELMLPNDEFEIDALSEICHRFGFYQYHFVNHLIKLNLITRLDVNLFKRKTLD